MVREKSGIVHKLDSEFQGIVRTRTDDMHRTCEHLRAKEEGCIAIISDTERKIEDQETRLRNHMEKVHFVCLGWKLSFHFVTKYIDAGAFEGTRRGGTGDIFCKCLHSFFFEGSRQNTGNGGKYGVGHWNNGARCNTNITV